MKNKLTSIIAGTVLGATALGFSGCSESVQEKQEKLEREQKEKSYYENPKILKGVVESKGDVLEDTDGFAPFMRADSVDYFFVRENPMTDSARTVMVVAYKSWDVNSSINIGDTLEMTVQHWQKRDANIAVYPSGFYDTSVKINGEKLKR